MLMLSQSKLILTLIDIPVGNLRFLDLIHLVSSCCATHLQKSHNVQYYISFRPIKYLATKPNKKPSGCAYNAWGQANQIQSLYILNLKIAMDSQSLKDGQKPKSRQRASPKKKKSQSISNKSQEGSNRVTDNMSYFDTIIARINNPRIEVDLKAQISKLITLCKSNPTRSLSLLCQIYSTSPSYFFERPKQSKGASLIIQLVSKEAHFYNVFPLMQQEKMFQINQKFIDWLREKQTVLNTEQLKKIQEMTKFVLERIMDGQNDRVLDKALQLVFKIPLALGHSNDDIQIRFCEGIIKDLLTNVTIMFDKNIKLSSQMVACILQFHRESFKFLTLNKCSSENYHLFDFGILSFTCKHGDICRQILAETFQQTSLFLGIKKDDSQDAIDPTKSIQEADYKINAVLLSSSFLRFNSILPPDSHQKKISYIREVTLLTLLASKAILMRLITQLEKIEKQSVPVQVIRGMFEIAKFCNDVNSPNILVPLLKKIQSIRELERYLKDQKPLPSSKDQDPFQALQKSIQGTLFTILRRIEKSLTSYNLQTYVDLYTENPLTFQSQTFVQHIFKGQHQEVVLSFFQGFTARWLHAEIKQFHFDYYLLHFLRKCVEEDRIGILGKYISNLPTDSLCKISLQVYKLSFDQENKKYVVPENGSRQIQFASLTSAGYSQKYILINQMMPVFSEQLVWRSLVNHIIPSLHFIIVKAYYSVVNYEFKNNDCEQAVMRLISAFENYIDKKMIEQVFSTFHLLHCILFREKQRQSKFSRCQGRLLHVILNKGTSLLAMHEEVRTGRLSAMCSLSLSKEMMSQMMQNHQKLNRMKIHFLKSTHSWLQNLRNIKEYVSAQQSYEDIIDAILQLSQNFQSREFHQVRYLSHYCSDKYFASLVQHKTRAKVARKQLMSYGFLMILKQAVNYFMGKYESQGIEDIFSITDKEIISYYDVIMRIPVDPTNEREILKAKLAVLYQITELTAFFNQNPNHRLFQFYKDIYVYSLRKILVEIAVQNPQYVSKYQREFIFQLRVVAIIEIMKNVDTVFEVLPTKEVFQLMFEMCFDKHVEIRFLIINSLCSRFKHEIFKKFLAEKYESAALLTVMASFDTNPNLKTVASRMVKTFRNSSNECTLGLVVLLYSIRHILNLTLRNLHREEYQTFVDSFLSHFHRLWLCEKQEEYSVYCFATRFLQQQRVKFILRKPSYESQIQSFYVEKQGTDYTLQRQMKEYLRKDDFSFEFPPEEASDPKEKMIANLMRSLPLRIFAKIKFVIERKTRGSRMLRHRKDIWINWKMLELGGLLQLLPEKCEGDVVALRL